MLIDLAISTQPGQTILPEAQRGTRQGPLLPSLGPGQGQSAPCNIIARLYVCSLHKCMSLKQQFEWRLHVTYHPKLILVWSWSPTPCSLALIQSAAVCKFTRSRSNQLLGCGRPLCAGWFESFRLFVRACESSVSGLALFTSLKLCTRYIMYMYILVHAALQAPCCICRLFSILDSAD